MDSSIVLPSAVFLVSISSTCVCVCSGETKESRLGLPVVSAIA